MSTVAGRRPRRLLRPETMESVFGYVYGILMANLLLVVANLPLAASLFLTTDALAAWPFTLLVSLTLGPSLAGVFEILHSLRAKDPVRPFAAFWRGYRRRGLPALLVGAATGAVVGFVLYDIAILAQTAWLPYVGPTLVVVAVWAVAAAVLSIAGLVVYPSARVRSIVKAAVYLSVRRWYFSLMSLVLVGVVLVAVLAQPVLGAVLVPAVLLYPAFANAQYVFQSALEPRV